MHKCRNLCYDFKKDYEIVLKVFHCVVLYSGNRILKSSFTSVLQDKHSYCRLHTGLQTNTGNTLHHMHDTIKLRLDSITKVQDQHRRKVLKCSQVSTPPAWEDVAGVMPIISLSLQFAQSFTFFSLPFFAGQPNT